MNNKLSGVIFMLFGIGLTGEYSHDLYYGFSNFNIETLKSAIFLAFGICVVIYGYKQFVAKKAPQKEEQQP